MSPPASAHLSACSARRRGHLTYSSTGDSRRRLEKITEGLGKEWMFLETLYRIYYTSGYNIAHVDVTARLCEERGCNRRFKQQSSIR